VRARLVSRRRRRRRSNRSPDATGTPPGARVNAPEHVRYAATCPPRSEVGRRGGHS
jgi:hypothetical protein